MDSDKNFYVLLAAVLCAFFAKLFYFNLIKKKNYKMFFRSFSKWYNMQSLIEDIDDSIENFMTTSNYCNLVIWIGSGALIWLLFWRILFPEN